MWGLREAFVESLRTRITFNYKASSLSNQSRSKMPFIYTLKVTVAFVTANPLGLRVSSTPYYYKTVQVHMNSPKVRYFKKVVNKTRTVKEVKFLSFSIWSQKKFPFLLSDYPEINKSLLIKIKKMRTKCLKTIYFSIKSISTLGKTNSM